MCVCVVYRKKPYKVKRFAPKRAKEILRAAPGPLASELKKHVAFPGCLTRGPCLFGYYANASNHGTLGALALAFGLALLR